MTSELFPQPPVGQPDDHSLRNNNDAGDRRTNQAANVPSGEQEAPTSGDPGRDGDNPNRPHDFAENAAAASASASTPFQRNNNLIQPHARFSRALNKGKVTVKFDPPM